MTDLARHEPILPTTSSDVAAAFTESLSGRTRVEYGRILAHFAQWIGQPDVPSLARLLLTLTPGHANATVLAWRNAMREQGLAPATVNQRLAAVRSLVKFARMTGVVTWALDVPSVKMEKTTDRRGPGEDGYAKMVAACGSALEEAVVRLCGDRGLRRAEVASLRWPEDVDGEAEGYVTLKVLRKGRTQRQDVTVHGEAMRALGAWIAERGDEAGALFPLSAAAVYRLVTKVAKRAGLKRRIGVHGLRRRAVTAALNVMHGDIRAVSSFASHADPKTTLVYDMDRVNVARVVAEKVAEIGKIGKS